MNPSRRLAHFALLAPVALFLALGASSAFAGTTGADSGAMLPSE